MNLLTAIILFSSLLFGQKSNAAEAACVGAVQSQSAVGYCKGYEAMASATLTHPAGGSTKRIGVTLNASDVALLRELRDRMTASMGRTSYVGVIRYGLHLVAAHLGMTDLPPGIPPAGPPRT